jgi:hypothetical protein
MCFLLAYHESILHLREVYWHSDILTNRNFALLCNENPTYGRDGGVHCGLLVLFFPLVPVPAVRRELPLAADYIFILGSIAGAFSAEAGFFMSMPAMGSVP